MILAAALIFYAVFTPAVFYGLHRLTIPTWKIAPRVPRVIDDRFLTPRGYWT